MSPKRNVLLKGKVIVFKHRRVVGGDVPLLLKHIPKSPLYLNKVGNGLPNANTQIGIETRFTAPNHSGTLGLSGGKILDMSNSNILKSMNFSKRPARGKNSEAKSKVIKIQF